MKKPVWIATAAASVLSFILLLSGFMTSVRDVTHPPEADWQQTDKNTDVETGTHDHNKTFSLVSLGDSLTRGTGDENGKGYVGILKDLLEKEYDNVIVHNHGVKGATLAALLEQIAQKEIRRTIAEASVVTVSIGGNDLFNKGKFLENVDWQAMADIQATATQNIDKLFAAIRSINREAPIVYVGLYNPFPELKDAKAYTKIVHEWNYEVSLKAIAYDNIVIVPTFDILRDPDNDLYSDHFHPNSKSYERIAERIWEVLK